MADTLLFMTSLIREKTELNHQHKKLYVSYDYQPPYDIRKKNRYSYNIELHEIK